MSDIPYNDLPPGASMDDVQCLPWCNECGNRRQSHDADDGLCGFCRREMAKEDEQ